MSGGQDQEQQQLEKQQSKLLSQQQAQLDMLNKQKMNDQLDFITRLQGQASTSSGVANTTTNTSTQSNVFSSQVGNAGLFTFGQTIG